MNAHDVVCPICGTVNYKLLLEETDGWMECENCGTLTKFPWKPQVQEAISVLITRKHSHRMHPSNNMRVCLKGGS